MAEDKKMVKVTILKHVGPYMPGQEVDVDEETAAQLCDGSKAMKTEDHNAKLAKQADVKKMTVAEMHEKGLKNVPVNEDLETLKKTESAAIAGKPVASGEPITVTGGVTPPSLVFPAFAEIGNHEVTEVKDVKPAKKDDKKVEEKKPEVKK